MEATWPFDDFWPEPQPITPSSLLDTEPLAPVSPPRRGVRRPRGTPEPIALHNVPFPSGWVLHAACRGLDTDAFFPHRGQDQTAIMNICCSCPVQLPCQEYALAVGALLQGVWGGLNERQRRKARAGRAQERSA